MQRIITHLGSGDNASDQNRNKHPTIILHPLPPTEKRIRCLPQSLRRQSSRGTTTKWGRRRAPISNCFSPVHHANEKSSHDGTVLCLDCARSNCNASPSGAANAECKRW